MQFLKTFKKLGLILFFIASFLCVFKQVEAFSEKYIDVIVKVHIGGEDGQLYSFVPESTENSQAFMDEFVPFVDNLSYAKNRDYARSAWIELSNW